MTEPTRLKLWRAVRVTPVKVPVTLEDCEEGRLAVCFETEYGEIILKKHKHKGYPQMLAAYPSGKRVFSYHCEVKFIRYLDDPQSYVPPVPTTFGELRDGQCFYETGDDRTHWRFGSDHYMIGDDGVIAKLYPVAGTPIAFIPDIEMVLEEQP